MPWKELHWALQEDPELRFVREAHLKELALLGIDLPFLLDGSLLKVKSGYALPALHPTEIVPDRLYHAIRGKSYSTAKAHGLVHSSRPYVPLFADKDLAIRVGRRRDPEALLLEIRAGMAHSSGIVFLEGGPGLFLVEEVSPDLLVFPILREDAFTRVRPASDKKEKPGLKAAPASPGSFLVRAEHLYGAQDTEKNGQTPKKARKSTDWKKERRQDRHKREI